MPTSFSHTMIKSIFSLLLLCLFTLSGYAQTDDKYASKVQSIDSIVTALYDVISAEKGEERDWDLMRHLFHSDAKLIPSGLGPDSLYGVRYITPDKFITGGAKWMKMTGFLETEIHREVQRFGHIAHVFSTYETYHSATETEPFMRGINSIQLLHDGQRWWIINIYWAQESKENGIPREYLR